MALLYGEERYPSEQYVIRSEILLCFVRVGVFSTGHDAVAFCGRHLTGLKEEHMNSGKTLRISALWLVFLLASGSFWISATDSWGSTFVPEQLDQMVAPIALYPDSLLAQVLIASTYPVEIVEADRWAKQNGNLKGDALSSALDKMDWDPSVKALVSFPQVLSMMSEQLDWTQRLGDAFLAQQADVMDAVQRLRAKAQAQGNLESTREQTVVVQDKAIIIEPANPQVIYVPAYNPVVVYGPWPYPAYPPYPCYPAGAVIAAGAVGFAAGVAVAAAWSGGWGHWNWGSGTLNVNVNKNININNNHIVQNNQGKWEHDPDHRKGVAYRDQGSRQRYSQKTPGSADARRDYRGHTQNPGEKGATPAGMKESGRTASPQQAWQGGYTGRQGQTGSSMGRSESRPTAFEGMWQGSSARGQSERGRMSRDTSMWGGGMSGGGMHGGFRRR
jgi:hypothetical protein